MDDASLLRYSRHILLPELGLEAQKRFAAAHLLVIGAGGLGAPATQFLGAAGVGKLTLCDPDAVDLTNLQRQILYATRDIGTPKVVAAQARVAAINPYVCVTAVQERAGATELASLVAGADVVLNLRKAPSRHHHEAIIKHCHKLGIRVIANYTLGLPNDTAEGILETIRYAKQLNTFAIQFTVTTPYPGTRFFRNVESRIFDRDWEHFNGWTSVFRHPRISPEHLHRLREFAYVSYHLRPRYIWRFLQSTLLHPLLFPDPVSCRA